MKPLTQPKNQKARIRTGIPGPKSRKLRAREDRHLAPGLQKFALMAGIVVDHAQGSAVTDVDGNTFLDLIGGIGVNGLGHSHPKYVAAVRKQLGRASVGSFTSPSRVELFERIGKHPPAREMKRIQLYSGGAEAVESALRLAKAHTGKHELASFWGGFHGKTLGALSLMGSDFKKGMGPLATGCHQLPYADCFRCPLRLKYPSCGLACAEVARKLIKKNSTGNVAAIIVEPMQGSAGNVIPPSEFLRAVREIADEIGALLIADEMITGFGRTGTYWGIEHSGMKPDIVTIGKQFGGGFPISGLIAREEIAASKPWSNPSGSSSSYGGNPLGAAAAAAALKIIDEERLVENSRKVGGYFLTKLKKMAEEFPFVGEARGSGLLLAIEFVSSKKTLEPLPSKTTRRFFQEFLKRGLLTMGYDARFRIQPSMTIDRASIDNALGIMRETFTDATQSGWWKKS